MDGDENNWDARNVTYRFKGGPLECPFYPGYYYIPGYSKYVINRDGDFLTVKTGKFRKWTDTVPAKESIRGGYKATTLTSDGGYSRSLGRHRAIALTFLDYDFHPDSRIINHKNGIGGDDRIDNLEWTTYSENVKHAYELGLYSNRTAAVDALNWKTGEAISFPSIQKCSEYTGFKHASISSRLHHGNHRRYEDGWRFKRADQQWLALNEFVDQRVTDRRVTARQLETGRIFVFQSIGECSRITGVHHGAIYTHCLTKVMTPLHGWNFRFLDEFSGWPKYSEKQIEIFKDYPFRPGDGIDVHDLETNETLFFTSAQKAADHFGISPITVSKLARYEGVRQKRYKFTLVKIREALSLH